MRVSLVQKSKQVCRTVFLLGPQGRILFLYLFQLLEAAAFLGLWPSSIFKASAIVSFIHLLPSSYLLVWLTLSPPLQKLLWLYWSHLDKLPISKSLNLITSAKFFCHVRLWGIRTWTSLWGNYSTYCTQCINTVILREKHSKGCRAR